MCPRGKREVMVRQRGNDRRCSERQEKESAWRCMFDLLKRGGW